MFGCYELKWCGVVGRRKWVCYYVSVELIFRSEREVM